MRNNFFTIITPTNKRPERLRTAIDSLLSQNYDNWEMIIINDSPNHDYSEIENYINKINKNVINKNGVNIIKYFKNENNNGKNYSCNFALTQISEKTDFILLLDDDDWLNDKALENANKIIENNPNNIWYVSNRFDIDKNIKLTQNKKLIKNNTKIIRNDQDLNNKINYIFDYLLFKKFSGDATHIIEKNFIKENKIHFSRKIKNGEEWFFFAQMCERFYYYDFNTTFTHGYQSDGLNTKMNKIKIIKNTFPLLKETIKAFYKNQKKLSLLFIYLILRILKQILK